MAAWILFVIMLGAVEMKSVKLSENTHAKRENVCYGALGCFSTDPPYSDSSRPASLVPESPDKIQTQFNLFTRESALVSQIVDARHPETVATVWTNFKSRPTKFIVHGYFHTLKTTGDWLIDMKDELLKHGDYNVVVVDWGDGDKPLYTTATANTRVVGAQLGLLIKELINTKGVNAGSFHIIGHSLGSHVAGYAGERIPGLGRITGLDPAGPYFDNTDPVVRLDPSDAVFVDTIHSDGENLINLGFGMRQPVGHVDFFPNLGHDQPGCTRDPIRNIADFGFTQGLKESLACSHYRSTKYFIESINSPCPFMAFPCASEDDFKNGRCHSCSGDGCAYMGIRADERKPAVGHHVLYYLNTSDHAPFCQYHVDVTIKFSTTSPEERGTISAVVTGSAGTTDKINLNDPSSPIEFAAGKTYTFSIGLPSDIGSVQSVSLNYDHQSDLSDPSTWNILYGRHPTLLIDEVDVFREEAQEDVHLCSKALKLEDNKPASISTKC